jgi:hypothetical protein
MTFIEYTNSSFGDDISEKLIISHDGFYRSFVHIKDFRLPIVYGPIGVFQRGFEDRRSPRYVRDM